MHATEPRHKNHVGVRSAVRQGAAPSFGRMFAGWAGVVVVAALLSSCTGGALPGSAESTPPAQTASQASSSVASPPSQAGAASPGGTAAGVPAGTEDPATSVLRQTVTDVLGRLAAGTPRPATAQVAEALTGAGIAATALEVSESITPTGLEADAIEAAVLQGSDCVVGQVRDGGVTVTVLPVLASGKCFVGSAA